jgi:phage host-nuclease inhibitor protein Gam
MQHIWKVLLTSLLIFALAATACLAEDSEAQYQAYSYTTFSLRRTPSESDRGISVQKKTKILILEWDDAWCKVQVGNKVGYAKPEWLYRVQSLDALHYPLQNLPHRMSGYVEFSQDTLISGGKFKGCTASAGQIACVEAQADGAYLLPVWRGEMQLTDEWLYRVQSLDALHYPLQNLPHRMSGYVEFSQDTLISGGKFKGCTASAGQIACVEAQADGAYLLPVWRGEMQLTDEIGTYHPFADWETAEPGDIIGGFTTFYGKQQGHGKAAAREHNISEGVKRIDGVAVEREETFSFNALCAPYRHSNGYELAPNVSTDGFGYGGGVCQVTTTLYNAALTLPLQIEEWALHSKQGAVYVPQFFDAAVGNYSDFTFVNLLPYGVQIHASAQNGVLTVLFCRAEEDSQ